MQTFFRSLNNPYVKTAWIIWLVFTVALCVGITINGNKRTVTDSYHYASLRWFDGGKLYNNTGSDFIYLPQSAILYAPFAYLPLQIREILWRVFCISLLPFAAIFPYTTHQENGPIGPMPL